MTGSLKIAVQKLANKLGYQIRRLDEGVALDDPYAEQQRILGAGVKTVFEIGAADGRDCERYARMFPDANVLAFEPVPESFAKIVERARISARIRPMNLAISDRPGHEILHLSNWIDASSLLKPKKTGSTFDAYQASSRSISVKVESVDHICELEEIDHINLLKMDAQGAELRILNGSSRMLAKESIDMIFTEVHFLESYEGAARFDEIMFRLVEAGFEMHNLYGINHNHQGRMTWADALFVHRRIAY